MTDDSGYRPLATLAIAIIQLIQEVRNMANALTNLSATVERNTGVTESAITLLQGLKAALDAAIASGDPVQIQALSDSLGAETDKLAAAITANTPAVPAAG